MLVNLTRQNYITRIVCAWNKI